MTHATVFIIMDAGRADYVRRETMPFLHGLARASVTGSFESPPGFAQRTVLFSGRYPDTSGNFSQFVFDPDRSPFRWVRKLGPLAAVVKPRKALWPTRMAIKKMTEWTTGEYHTDPAWIPPKFLPFFAMCEDTQPMYEPGALGAPSIFDLCREKGLRFRYLAHPVSGDDDEIHALLVRELRANAPYDFYVAQFSVTDERGHQDGPFSGAMQEGHLPKLDRRFASIHAALAANYDSWDLFICGDHGMAPVERRVDVLAKLKKECKAKPGRDYVVFINSTLAVFWYLTPKGRTEVEALLPRIPGSHLVDEAERKRRRIPLDEKWGHRMLAAEPGVMYWPDYFHVRDSTIVGMHGYLDKATESYGAMVIASSHPREPRALGLRPLVDVFPTLCEMLKVPVPDGQEGVSLLAAPELAVAQIAKA